MVCYFISFALGLFIVSGKLYECCVWLGDLIDLNGEVILIVVGSVLGMIALFVAWVSISTIIRNLLPKSTNNKTDIVTQKGTGKSIADSMQKSQN